MRYEVEPDGTLRIVEDDKPTVPPHKPSPDQGPQRRDIPFAVIVNHVCCALIAIAIVLGVIMGLKSPQGLWGTFTHGFSRGWDELLLSLENMDLLYGPRVVIQHIVALRWDHLLLWLLQELWFAVCELFDLAIGALEWIFGLLVDLLNAIF